MPEPPGTLIEVLEEAKRLGFLGPGPVETHIDHAAKYVGVVRGESEARGNEGERAGPVRIADLGSGGGVPGLVVAMSVLSSEVALVDSSQRRCSFLTWAALELGVSDRVSVVCDRAEIFGRDEKRRDHFGVVTARGFGPPSWTVECGAPLLIEGGVLVISEPPTSRSWPDEALKTVGLRFDRHENGVAVLRKISEVPGDFPRSPSRQKRYPLFID